MKAFINRNAKISVVVAAASALLTFTIMVNKGRCLKTDLTPGGILSLELAWDQEYANALRNEWQKPCKVISPLCVDIVEPSPIIRTAIANINWDFAFMAGYLLLLCVLVVLHETKFARIRPKPRTAIVLIFCFGVFALDGIENFLMLSFLNGGDVKSWIIAMTALTKFGLLTLIILYILWRGSYLKRFSWFSIVLSHILWANRVSVTGLLVLYFALWKSDQGQDLLINLNASHWGPVTFYIILSILATFYWYWPKYFSLEKWKAPSRVSVSFKSLFFGDWNVKGESLEATYVPRLLGLLTFIVPACGILQALDIFEISYPLDFMDPLLFLFISIAFFLVMMDNEVFEIFFENAPRLYESVVISLLLLIFGLGFLNKYSANQLGLLSLGLYAIAFVFMMLTSVRNRENFYRGKLLRKLQQMKANTWMLSFVTLAAVIFFALNCYPYFTADGPYRFITLPVVLTAIVFYSYIFFLLMIWGKKKATNFSAFLIVFAIIVAVIVDNRYHDIKTVEREAQHRLPSLSAYMHNWVLSKKHEILERKGAYPVFIVNSYGGGVRAAAWATLSISFLDSLTDNRFQDHVLAYSGASGGTIGSSVLCAVRRNEKMDSLRPGNVKHFYQNDFLTPVLIGLFGRDVWFSTLGISWFDDRARLQDKIWERHTVAYAGDYYSGEYTSLWYPDGSADYKVPLLFSNTYHVEKGFKAVLAPVGLDTAQFESAVIVNNLLKGKSILYSTGSFLSARFPYISPAGKLDDKHHFLDGGLKENSGAETAEEIYRVFQKLADTVNRRIPLPSGYQEIPFDTVRHLYSKIRIYFLSLNNSVAAIDDPGPTRNLVELTAPFEALYNNWVGNTAKADSILRLRHRERYFELRPTAACVDGFKPVLPLGWQISDHALTSMIQSLKQPCSTNLMNIDCIERILEEDTSKMDCETLSLPCKEYAGIPAVVQ